MPTTQLQLGAWGGRRYGSFAGRVAVVAVNGPWCVEARQSWSAGSVAGQAYSAGAERRGHYNAGAVAVQEGCCR